MMTKTEVDIEPEAQKTVLDLALKFYGILVKHIKNLLEEREKCLLEKEWVLKEALNSKRLQSGGTFQNVLTRRLDEVIVPAFAYVIQFMDHYSNLSLLKKTKLLF